MLLKNYLQINFGAERSDKYECDTKSRNWNTDIRHG